MTVAHRDHHPTAPSYPHPQIGTVNVAKRLAAMAQRFPQKRAVVWPTGRNASGKTRYAQITFQDLNRETDRYAHGLVSAGITRGTRTIVFVKPGVEFFSLVFALFKVGAVPVMIDPGIGKRQMRHSLAQIGAEAFIGTPLAHLFRKLCPEAFQSVKVSITVGRRWAWGGLRLGDIRTDPWRPFESFPTRPDDPAAILFTSGSTGPAKGVLYEHGVLDAQVGFLDTHFAFSDADADLPTFPLFALFDVALGVTAVIPDMDFTRPGSVDPRRIIEPIHDHRLTHMFGSPALLDRLSRFGQANGVKLPTIKRVITAGAPVPPEVLERMHRMLPAGAQIHTPYGATEALPVASISSREILRKTRRQTARGRGTCVGRPLQGLDLRIIRIDDEPIPEWSDDLELPPGEIGEVVVKGPVVTRSYYNLHAQTELAKIHQGDSMWHRMGDVGYFDDQRRLWFCGRKAQRVITENGTLFTVPCEAIFNQHPQVYRSALVGVGDPTPRRIPVICIELEPSARKTNRQQLTRELLERARASDLTRDITTILYHPALPVDVRHNAKIRREDLAVWAAGKLP